MGQYLFLVKHCFIQFFLIFSFSPLFAESSSILFRKAFFSDAGICMKDISADSSNLSYAISNVLFSFDGGEAELNSVSFISKSPIYFMDLKKARFFSDTFDIYSFSLRNSKGAFFKASKISNIGKISALNCGFGYRSLGGWRFNSRIINFDDSVCKVTCVGNSAGFGFWRCPFPNLVFNTKPASGLLFSPAPQFARDFSLHNYFSFSYYFLPTNYNWDLIFSPMFYSDGLGLSCSFRELSQNMQINLYSENFLKRFWQSSFSPNVIFSFLAKNSYLDADIHCFKTEFFNDFIWKNMNYKNFTVLSKDYWGYFILNYSPFKFSFLQRNYQNLLRAELDFLRFFKLKLEQGFDKKIIFDLAASKKVFIAHDFFLIELAPEISYRFFDSSYYKASGKKVSFDPKCLKIKLDPRLDFPMFSFNDIFFQGSFIFEHKAPLYEWMKYCFTSSHDYTSTNDWAVEFNFFVLSMDSKIFWKNTKNFEIDCTFANLPLDSIFFVREKAKNFIGFSFLSNKRSYGLKFSIEQIILESSFIFQDFIKLRFLGSYAFKDFFSWSTNYKNMGTYFNSELELSLNSWKISLSFGFKNLSGSGVTYGFSISPKEWASFAEIDEFLQRLQVERNKVLKLYNEIN